MVWRSCSPPGAGEGAHGDAVAAVADGVVQVEGHAGEERVGGEERVDRELGLDEGDGQCGGGRCGEEEEQGEGGEDADDTHGWTVARRARAVRRASGADAQSGRRAMAPTAVEAVDTAQIEATRAVLVPIFVRSSKHSA